jgi:L-asparaginase/Glu-tRNA(Gln) amidotransferase subunit D
MSQIIYGNPVVQYQRAAASPSSITPVDAATAGLQTSQTSRVLVIYTGGTIGMQSVSTQGYVPVANWLNGMHNLLIQNTINWGI